MTTSIEHTNPLMGIVDFMDKKWITSKKFHEDYKPTGAVKDTNEGAEFERYESILSRFKIDTYQQFCGWWLRQDIKKNAVRFWLYYKAGYEVRLQW